MRHWCAYDPLLGKRNFKHVWQPVWVDPPTRGILALIPYRGVVCLAAASVVRGDRTAADTRFSKPAVWQCIYQLPCLLAGNGAILIMGLTFHFNRPHSRTLLLN